MQLSGESLIGAPQINLPTERERTLVSLRLHAGCISCQIPADTLHWRA